MNSHFSDFVESAQSDLNTVEQTAVSASKALFQQSMLLAQGAVSGAVFDPINAVEQIVGKMTGMQPPHLEFSNQKEVDASTAGKIGEIGGSVLSFVMTEGGVSIAAGAARGSLTSLGLTGALQGGVLRESDNKKEGLGFVKDRLQNACIDIATFVTMGGASKTFAPFVDGTCGTFTGRVGTAMVRDGLAGVAGGAASAEATAIIKEGRLATKREMHDSMKSNALFGMGMGAFNEAIISAAEARNPGIRQPQLTEAERTASRSQLQNMVKVEPSVSPEFVQKTMGALQNVHETHLLRMQQDGVKIRLIPSIRETFPQMVKDQPRGHWFLSTWDSIDGFYHPLSREVVIAEKSKRIYWPEPVASGRTDGVARHELGHGLDDALKEPSLRKQAFVDAHSADVAQIPPLWKVRLDYYIQAPYLQSGRSEAFADLFAVLHGGPCNRGEGRILRQYFPRTLRVLSDMLDQQRSAAPPPVVPASMP
jgi:hypothetical protein